MTTPVDIVTYEAGVQMGVSILLEGMNDWPSYLERQVDDSIIDQDTADEWAEHYDGYQIKWTFAEPAVVATASGALDAACIRDTVNADGGICVGLEYTGSISYTAEKWAIWVPEDNFYVTDADDETNNIAQSSSLVGEVDSDNWFVEGDTTTFTGTFTFYRWQPVEEVDYRYYTYEYRWYATELVQAYKYYSPDTTSWYFYQTGTDVELLSAIQHFAFGATLISAGLASMLM